MFRKTKIIATLGPATDSEENIRALIEAGARVFRLNMSHAAHDWTRQTAARVRNEAVALGEHVALLMDLQGPAIRTGSVDAPIALKIGDQVEFTIGGAAPRLPYSTTVNYDDLPEDVKAGDRILVDNGVLHLKVVVSEPERIQCEVLTAGELGSRRHINLPGVRIRLPALTEKDWKDLKLAMELEVDFVAMSFVREAAHVDELRTILEENGSGIRIVAKLEDQEAMKNLDDIIMTSDVVMIARGDLGIEVHIEELPIAQRRIVKRCMVLGRRVIVATHLLESMIDKPVPTRAEVTDVANAVFEQADALMLSGETSIGSYPAESVQMLDCIARRIEASGGAGYAEKARLDTSKAKTARSAVVLANSLVDSVILIFTSRGIMANLASHLRPDRAPIFAFSEDDAVCRALLMNRAVQPFLMDFAEEPEDTVRAAIDLLLERELVKAGQPTVILSDVLISDPEVDSILLRQV